MTRVSALCRYPGVAGLTPYDRYVCPVSGILARVKEGAETMGGIIQARAGGVGLKAAGENRKGQYRAARHAARETRDFLAPFGNTGDVGWLLSVVCENAERALWVRRWYWFGRPAPQD